MDRRQSRLLTSKLFVKIARVGAAVLQKDIQHQNDNWNRDRPLTMVGKYGGGMRLFKTSSKLISLKKGCRLISSASSFPDPKRRVGSRLRSYHKREFENAIVKRKRLTFCKIETASLGMVMGYSGSSSRIASKISSSSSPRKGDCPSNIS